MQDFHLFPRVEALCMTPLQKGLDICLYFALIDQFVNKR